MQLCNLLKALTVDYNLLHLNIVFEVTFCQEENRVILRVQVHVYTKLWCEIVQKCFSHFKVKYRRESDLLFDRSVNHRHRIMINQSIDILFNV